MSYSDDKETNPHSALTMLVQTIGEWPVDVMASQFTAIPQATAAP